VAPSPPQALPQQTRRNKKAIAQQHAAAPSSEKLESSTPSPSSENALLYVWYSPSRRTLAAANSTAKPSIKLVVPKADIEAFLALYEMKSSDETATITASRKRGVEDPYGGSPPTKRTRISPAADVLSIPAYDRDGNLLLAADADDTELPLSHDIPSHTTGNILAGFGIEKKDRQEAVNHIGTETPHPQEVIPATQTPSHTWGLASVLGSVRAAGRLFPMFRSAPLNFTATADATIPTADSGAGMSENIEPAAKHSKKKSSKSSKKSSKSEDRKATHKKKRKEKMNKEEKLKAMLEANKLMIQNEVDRKVIQTLKEEHEAAQAAQAPGTKRKRFSPSFIPNPIGCSYGMDLDYFGDDSDEEEQVSAAVEPELETQPEPEPEPSPSLRAAKRVRFTADTRFPLEPSLTQRQSGIDGSLMSNLNTARDAADDSNPVTAPLFSGSLTIPTPNIFTAAAQSKASPPPIVDNRTFTVPDESDSDESLLEPADTDEGKAKEGESANNHEGNGKGVDFSTRNVGASKPWQQDPPPAPTPSHAALPGSKLPSKSEESLARLRSEALRFTPKQPSTLRSVSRLSNSTVASSDSGDHEEITEAPAGTNVAAPEGFREETPFANRDLFRQAPTPATDRDLFRSAPKETPAATRDLIRPAPTETPAAIPDLFRPASTEIPPATRDLFRPASTETPAANREAFREVSGNQLNWLSEMEAERVKYAEEHQQQYIPMDPVVADLVNQIPLSDLIQFEFPSLEHTGHAMDPEVKAILDAMPDDELIQFEFPHNQ